MSPTVGGTITDDAYIKSRITHERTYNMKKKITGIICALCISTSCISVFAEGSIPDHKGTPMDGIEIGTSSLNSAVKSYYDLFERAGNQYGVDPNLLAAICMQESSGRNLSYREDGSEYPAWGIMQIEYSHEKSFKQFGINTTGEAWTLKDRLDPEKAVPYAAWLISNSLIAYDCDYMKMIQAYNFGETVLNRIIEAKGDEWLDERKNAVNYVSNWNYKSYGDALYIEHVLRYYHNELDYLGAKVRINDKLLKFENQYPLVIDGHTLIPIRAVSEALGAEVEWLHEEYTASIVKDGIEIEIPVNENTAYVNDEEVELDCSAQILNGRTMVPLRFIAEELNADVQWEQESRTVLITDK